MRQTFARLSKLFALAALVGGSLFGVGAVTASAQPLDGWACSVPAGYTYDQVANQLGVCNPSGFAYSYHLRTPQDNINTCSVIGNFTYDRVSNQLNVCNPSGFAYSYHMRTPVNGLWACSVPAGWTYNQTSNQLNVCNPSGFAYSYHLLH